MRARVTIITAPAGFGKTIALNEVRHGTTGAHVRLDLNANVETFSAFLYELSCILEPLAPGIKASFAAAYERALGEAEPERSLTAWLHKRLGSMGVTIFIDQLQYLRDQDRVAQFLTAAIEKKSSPIHWVFATRHDFGLPLVRWKANGVMKAPIDAAALRFEFYDVARMAARLMVERTHTELKAIYEGTNGWPMGVAFALRTSAHLSHPESCSDIAEDVYAKRSQGEQEFLRSTCLLSTLDDALCKAAGWARVPEILSVMQPDAPFIFIPSERDALQFHDTFASHVQQILKSEPAALSASLKNAASALEKRGDMRSLLLLYVRFGNPKQVAHALASASAQLLAEGHRELVLEALSLLDPDDRALSSVILALKASVSAHSQQNRVKEIDRSR